MSKKFLVFAEVRDGEIRQVSFEAIAAAKKIEDDGEITAVLFGEVDEKNAQQLGHYGADQILIANNNDLNQYTVDGYSQALVQVVEQVKPDITVLGHTALGKDLAPRAASKLGLGLVSDCIDVENENEVTFVRPIYAGKAFQKRKMIDETYFVTIRPNNFEASESDQNREVSAEYVDVHLNDIRTVIKDIVKKASNGIDLTEAKVIVSGGRGVKSSDGFNPLYELAEVLGAAVGASRGACDSEYCDYSMQVGQTGKVVTPDLYIACGISGAVQHLAGMSNSKYIVAINKDPEAPIFNVADYGIVGDLFEVVPLLTEEFKKMQMQAQ